MALQSKGLLATEGVVTIPFQGLHPIAIRSHFYEFADANGAIHTADQLQLGGRYTVILTTSGGLWRYQLGDEVEVDGFVGSTPSLRFLGRCGKVSDLCGEKLHESFVTEALAKLFATSNVAFAILAPETPARTAPHYTLFSHDSLPPHALERLEDELRKNPHYAHCRTLGQLGQLKHCSVAGDGHATLVALDLKNGRKLGDIKPQSLSTRTDLREHLVCGDCMPSGKSDTNRH